MYNISRDSLLHDSNFRIYSSMFRKYFNIIYSASISCTYRWMLYVTGCLYFLHMCILAESYSMEDGGTLTLAFMPLWQLCLMPLWQLKYSSASPFCVFKYTNKYIILRYYKMATWNTLFVQIFHIHVHVGV